ncbi:UDP-glycosyltransferase UGT5-like [Tribolium castaneum]|uniref:UDP-glycosyltransferase UGT5-like n=1 Tax=Tribolium castaneum TaxID=7070 RepID=UPI0030FEC960
MIFKKIFFFLIILLDYSSGSKILGIFPTFVRSHYYLANTLMNHLAEKGHRVTVISPFLDENPAKNNSYQNVVLTGLDDLKDTVNMFDYVNTNELLFIVLSIKKSLEMTELVLNHTNVQYLLQSNEKFDLVIMERFVNEAYVGFAEHFNCPYIVLSTFGTNPWINVLTGNPAPPSYIPNPSMPLSSKMNFWERQLNTLMYIYVHFLHNFYAFPGQKLLYEKYFNASTNFYDVLYRPSLVLLNSHPVTNQPVPYVPNMIDIGGFHIKPRRKISKDLQIFLDEAKEGVIYFSMGSFLKSTQQSPEKHEIFLKTFSKLKLKVLWKWESDRLANQSRNIRIEKWVLQQSVLEHPNVRLFITHGGLLSISEAVHSGIPMLVVPVFGDQKINSRHVADQGMGLWLEYHDVTESTLTKKINEILYNPIYLENVKLKSKIYNDRLVDPLDVATYWVEYVIRHKGAPHLRIEGVNLSWYKYFLIDVIITILMCVFIAFYLICIVLRTISSFYFKCKCEKVKLN